MSRFLSIGTVKGKDAFVVERIVGKEELSRLFEYRLDLVSEHGDYKAKDILGTNATVGMELPGGVDARYFNGYVTRFSFQGQVRTAAYKSGVGFKYQLTLSPWMWFLNRTSTCAIFQQKKILDVIQEIFDRVSELKSVEIKVSGESETRDYNVQYRETDFNFVNRLMEQAGIYYYFTHEDGKHKLVLIDTPNSHPLTPGRSNLRFSAESAQDATLRNWVLNTEIQSGAYAIDDFDYNKPGTRLLKVSPKERPHKNAGFEIYDYPGEYEEPSWGEKYAAIRMEEMHCQYELCRGGGVDRNIRPGFKFKLVDHPVDELNKEYLVIAHNFTGVNNLVDTGGSHHSEFECSFTVIPAATQFRPPRITPLPSIAGPQTAIVVGPAGEEIYTDQLGRVKLQFHWDRYSTGTDQDSCWVRVSNPLAGKGWGAINIPRVGQEVIVEFMEGDPDRPIVTGRVYNGDNQTPYDMPSKKMYTGMKTRSYPNGGTDEFNELRFDDTKGSEQIFFQAQKWMDIRVKHNYKEWIGGVFNSHVCGNIHTYTDKEYHLTSKGDMRLISKDGMIEVGAKQDIAVVSEAAMFLEAPDQITLKSSLIFLEGSDSIQLKAGKIFLTGSQKIDLKVGGSFVSIHPGGVDIKGPMVNINSGGSATAANAVPATPLPDPKLPAIALTSVGGEKSPPPKKRTKPVAYSGQATAFKVAAGGGGPFVEECNC
ncbi:type VI secretion system Vgr family protein [Piscinibacter sakaiensis]|uniref:type VI secretion system Vgr family protein n=1 Tax=Piscinibacter sakaiensis TaxID=1547922 RepID=UPI003AAC7D1E